MRTQTLLSLALGGLSCLPMAELSAQSLPSTPPAPTTNLSAADEKAVRSELVTLVEDAVIADRFEQLVNQFSRVDRTRAQGNGPAGASDPAAQKGVAPTVKLEVAIADFQKAWKDKYHQDFNLRGNETQVFNRDFARIEIGDFGDVARTAGEKLPAPTSVPARNTTGTLGVNTKPPANPAATQAAAVSRANNRAIAAIAASQGIEPLTLPFVQEGGVWKYDAPGQVDRQMLQQALSRCLQRVTQESDKWPQDQHAAYRLIAHQVFIAVHEATSMKAGTDNGSRASAD